VQNFYDTALFILKILRDPIWGGISSIYSLIGIPLAILLARQSNARQPQIRTYPAHQKNSHVVNYAAYARIKKTLLTAQLYHLTGKSRVASSFSGILSCLIKTFPVAQYFNF